MARLPTLRIWLLGGFRAELDGRPIPDAAWPRNRPRAVVKLLALDPGHRLHREQLMDALWPDLPPRAAGSNLRKAVHFARRALGPGVLTVGSDIVGLEARVEVDVEAFAGALDGGRLEEAIEAYASELLPEDRFEPWSDEPRERLAARYARALGAAAAAAEEDGDTGRAIELLQRLAATEPLDEHAQRRLMALHAAAGERHLALRQFRQLERALREELGVDPSPATRALFDQIIAGGLERRAATPRRTTSVVPRGPGEAGVSERRLVTVVSASTSRPSAAPDAARILDSWGAMTAPQPASVLATFGVPVIGEDDAERAVRAALELVVFDPGARVGVATGEIVLPARAGLGEEPESGGPAELAAALRELGAPGVPLATGRTARAAGQGIRFGAPIASVAQHRDSGAVPVLGTAPLGEPSPVREAPLVGRRTELDAILGFVAEVKSRESPRLLVLAGSAGVGKSRLVREVGAALGDEVPATRVLRGRSLSGGRGATYWALGEVLRDACGMSLADPPRATERRLRSTVDSVLAGLPPQDRAATVAALATSAGIRLADNPLEGLKPEEVSRALGVAWPRFAAGLAASSPIVLVLEDLHWASTELLEMLELIVARSSGPLLVLATARPELWDSAPAFGAGVDASTIALGPLSGPESGELVSHLADAASFDPADRERILARAEGNPFYLEQLTAHLREAGRAGLPDTLQSLLGARLDALAPADRRVLQDASVVGRVFWAEPLERALPGERVGDRLALLERKRFVVRRPLSTLSGHDEYAFRHALLHDVAYHSVPRGRRARAHARAGAWLEGIAGSRAEEVIDLLAHHFESAVPSASLASDVPEGAPEGSPDLRAKAIDYLVRAGEAARRRFALDRAIDLHRRALALAADDAPRIRALEALAEDHESGFHGDAAAAAYREALIIARRASELGPNTIARLARKLAWLMAWNPGAFRASPDPADAEALVAEGLATDPGELERGWLVLVRGSAARLYRGSEPFGQGSRTDPRPLGDRIADVDAALAIGRELADQELIDTAGHARGMLYGLEGRFRDMLELSRIEVARLPPGASNLDRSDALRRLAVNVINIEGDFEAGVELGRQSRVLAGDLNPHQLLHTLWPIMAGLYQLGRWHEVAGLADEVAAAFHLEPATECQFVRDGPVIAGAALASLGRPDEARTFALLAGDPLADRSSASAWQARFATITGEAETARAISIDKALEQRTYGPQHAYALVEALEALKDWPAFAAYATRARATIAGNAALRPLLDRVAGRARAASGDEPAGRQLLRRAAAGFRRLGMVAEEARTREALGTLGGSRPGAPPGPGMAEPRAPAGIGRP